MDRLRWGNIARAAAVLAVLALVVAWPRLRSAPPALPPAAALPVTVEDPAPAAPAPTRRRAPAHRERAVTAPSSPHRRRRAHAHRHAHPVVRMRRASRRVAPVAPAPPLARRPRPSADDVGAGEFALP